MNKYQEALSDLSWLAESDGGSVSMDEVKQCTETLKELVDRATLKKPSGIDTTVSWFTSGICECGNTVFMFDINGDLDDKFCKNCGQALDWSEDE